MLLDDEDTTVIGTEELIPQARAEVHAIVFCECDSRIQAAQQNSSDVNWLLYTNELADENYNR